MIPHPWHIMMCYLLESDLKLRSNLPARQACSSKGVVYYSSVPTLVAENRRSLLAFHHAMSISALFRKRSARCIRCVDALRTSLVMSSSVSFDGAYKCTLEGKVEGLGE